MPILKASRIYFDIWSEDPTPSKHLDCISRCPSWKHFVYILTYDLKIPPLLRTLSVSWGVYLEIYLKYLVSIFLCASWELILKFIAIQHLKLSQNMCYLGSLHLNRAEKKLRVVVLKFVAVERRDHVTNARMSIREVRCSGRGPTRASIWILFTVCVCKQFKTISSVASS